MFYSCEVFGIAITIDVRKRVGSIKMVNQQSKHFDTAAHNYEVPGILASVVFDVGMRRYLDSRRLAIRVRAGRFVKKFART